MKGLKMTRAEAEEHQRRHGFKGIIPLEVTKEVQQCKRDRMNGTETRYSLILEAMKRRGDILWWRFEGVTLSWGADPATGKPMRYTPDFCVLSDSPGPLKMQVFTQADISPHWKMIEVKGGHIRERDLVRFKGCRADWPMFDFEMHQWKGGEWKRIH